MCSTICSRAMLASRPWLPIARCLPCAATDYRQRFDDVSSSLPATRGFLRHSGHPLRRAGARPRCGHDRRDRRGSDAFRGRRQDVTLSAKLQAIFDTLMAAHPSGLTLNVLSDELVDKPVDFGEIEQLIVALEEAGVDLEGPEPPPQPEQLFQVLTAARALAAETGKRPTTAAIAARTGLTLTVVRRALRLGKSAAST